MDIKNIDLLYRVLISDNAVNDFFKQYNGNSSFRNWLDTLIPEVAKANDMEQNNPWHIYDVLTHILHSVQAMNSLSKKENPSDRKMLAYTMFFHDLGKPETRSTREKDGKMIDSFFNHNIASEKIAGRVLPDLGFSKDQVEVIKKLVYKHDIFMFIRLEETSNSYWRKLDHKLIDQEVKELSEVGNGEKLMKHLVMVGRADNLAQNPKMTEYSLKMLDTFDKMLSRR